MADGISDVSLVEFIPKERNYLDEVINKDEFVNLDFLNDPDANDELLITFEESRTIQPNCEGLEGTSVFKSTSESDPDISHLEKYIDWKFSETVRPSQNKTQGCCSEDINCSRSLFNEQNNKKYGSFSQNKPTLREFITPPNADLDIAQATHLEERET